MAPQTDIPISANVLSTIGTILWCVQLVPQIWHNWRCKSTEGLPIWMMLIWGLYCVPFGTYAIVQNFAIAIQVQPQIFGALCFVNCAQIWIYHNQWDTWRAVLLAAALGALVGGLEVLLVLTLRGPNAAGVTWPMLLVGILAAILLAAGLFPTYYEIWKRRGRVVGIAWPFLATDWLGGFFSLMALVAQNSFDVLGGVSYIIMMAEETGIALSHILWRLRTRELHAKAKAAGLAFDDLAEASRYQAGVKPGRTLSARAPEDAAAGQAPARVEKETA